MKQLTIAIDGPAGAGKSTIARALAKRQGVVYVDTGAMYRAMALHFLRNGISPEEEERLEQACRDIDVSLDYRDGEQVVFLNGENVNGSIRTREVGNMASATSVNRRVREKLVELQRGLAKQQGVVMDGRDIGTVVLPDAPVKIYLTATVDVRAKRRYEEMRAKGTDCDYEVLKQEIAERDERDMTREHSPLRKAEDAVVVDTSDLSVEEVLLRIEEIIGERLADWK